MILPKEVKAPPFHFEAFKGEKGFTYFFAEAKVHLNSVWRTSPWLSGIMKALNIKFT